MLNPGDTFERYTIEALIGQGGMGCVYRAHDPRLGRRVALKVISEGFTSSDASARLVREARAAAALDHPNAVAIFDVGELAGAPYIVMELVEGRTLRRAVGDATAPIPTRVAQLADVARALAGAHKRGLIHRDIKPENVMVRDDGMVKVLDFGIARRAGGSVDPEGSTQAPALTTLTAEGLKLGTPVYMAPEQIRGDALDGRADQFAWGVLAYELLAGRLPWRGAGDALAVMASVLTDPADRAALEQAGVSPELRIRGEEKSTALADTAKRDAWLRQERVLFYRHAGIYLIVNAALLVLGLVLLSFTPWWIWFLPALAWGVGVAIHGLIAMTSNEQDWTEHREGMQSWRESRRRRHEVALARAADPRGRDRGAREEPRKRSDPPHEAEKLRVAMDTGRERAAEEEAEREGDPEVKRRRR